MFRHDLVSTGGYDSKLAQFGNPLFRIMPEELRTKTTVNSAQIKALLAKTHQQLELKMSF